MGLSPLALLLGNGHPSSPHGRSGWIIFKSSSPLGIFALDGGELFFRNPCAWSLSHGKNASSMRHLHHGISSRKSESDQVYLASSFGLSLAAARAAATRAATPAAPSVLKAGEVVATCAVKLITGHFVSEHLISLVLSPVPLLAAWLGPGLDPTIDSDFRPSLHPTAVLAEITSELLPLVLYWSGPVHELPTATRLSAEARMGFGLASTTALLVVACL